MCENSVILYGAGYRGKRTFIKLAEENVHVEAFCDRNAERIKRYCGCCVLIPLEGERKYRDLPFIVTIDNDVARNEVITILKENGIEAYDSFDDFYQGKVDVELAMTKCGEAAPYQIYAPILKENSVVYSFGIGFDYSFEQELVDKYGATVYAFDPSPEVIEKMSKEKGKNLIYYPYRISDKDGMKTFLKPRYKDNYSEFFSYWTSETEKIQMEVYCLKSLMKRFGHSHIDLLKMDVEGTEFLVLDDIINDIDIDQICIETHARVFTDSVNRMNKLKELFHKNGFVLVSNGVHEHTYVKMDLLINDGVFHNAQDISNCTNL